MANIDFCDLYNTSNVANIISYEKERNRLSHAYLITTKDTLTSEYITKSIAMHIMSSGVNPDPNDISAKKVLHGNHVDVRTYPKTDKAISSEEIREIVSEAYIKPTDAEYKIFVLNNFDEVGVLTQNKILKTLEEPPTSVILILSCTHSDRILATIKSRCTNITLNDFSDSDISKFLQANKLDPANIDIADCMGSLGRAIDIATSKDYVAIKALAGDIVYKLSSSSEAIEYTKRIIDQKRLDNLIDEIILCTKDAILKDKISARLGYKITKIVLKYKKNFLANGNPSVLADSMILDILEAKYLCKK